MHASDRQMYKPVSMDTRKALCRKFNMHCHWEGKESDFELRYTSGILLEAPPYRESTRDVAEVGGECLFSSVYFLLCGKQSS